MNKSINIIDNPNIIPRAFEYNYESFHNTPNIVLVIENKTLTNEILNKLALNKDEISFKINYEDKNPLSPNNIFNVFNNMHKELITNVDFTLSRYYKNGYSNSNFNFAYHYFIDKKGNIYEGRPHNIRAFNLDIFEGINDNNEGKILNQGDLLFNESLIILTEEQTDEIDTTNATYTALKSLLIYLRQKFGLKKFFCYNELRQFKFNCVESKEKDFTRYNNPGLFFKVNELHSSVEKKALKVYNEESGSNVGTYTYGERVLRYTRPKHMTGNDIIMLQKMLYKLEIIKKYKDITGEYDLLTKQAVNQFQLKFYITPEYEYGTACKTTLNTLREKIYQEKINNIKIIDDTYNLNRVLEYNENNNMVGLDVLLLQTKLKNIIYPILKENGIYDKYTEDAVKMYQAKYAHYENSIDGKVGPNTWKSIFDCKDTIFIANTDSVIEGAITPTKNTVSKTNIEYLQRALNKALELYKTSIIITGYYDEPTQNYIKLINSNKSNRKIMGLDKYTDKDGNPLDWNNDFILKTCYPAEFIYLIKHYLLNQEIELELVY